jgi:4-hydroxy-tetrahydrodipicolinate reductase
MKIALFGYGKMGKMIEQIALERGHQIVARVDVGSPEINYREADVAIDFSTPEAAFNNIKKCFVNKVPVISGTTGWLDKFEQAVALCHQMDGAFIYASNFSLGVNIFFELNAFLAGMMDSLPEYTASVEETHHIHKVDAPSGTAITLAEGIIEKTDYTGWCADQKEPGLIPVHSKREGEVPGTHTVTYRSPADSIEIRHTANNREGFALGAVVAAEWLQGKTGVFSMRDVLNLHNTKQ